MRTQAAHKCLAKSMLRRVPSCLQGHCGRSFLPNKSRAIVRILRMRSSNMGTMQSAVKGFGNQTKLTGEFFNKLSPEATRDLASVTFSHSYPAGMILFSEKDPAPGLYIVLEGE